MKRKILHGLIITIIILTSINLISIFAQKPLGVIHVGYYRSDTIAPYNYWYEDQYCEWLNIRITMVDITNDRRLLCTVEERDWENKTLIQTLYQGYLRKGDTTGYLYPSNSRNHIYIKLTEVDGYQTYFKIYIEGDQFSR